MIIALLAAVVCMTAACTQKTDAENATLNPTATMKPAPPQAAVDALKRLRKIAGATEIGITYQEYGSRLIDLKADIDDLLTQVPNGELKKEIGRAMEAYIDALTIWRLMTGYDFEISSFGIGKTLQEKYSIPQEQVTENAGMMIIRKQPALNTIWFSANTHINNASRMLE